MQNLINVFLLLVLYLVVAACSDEADTNNSAAKKDHVWKETTETIDRAKEVEGLILDAAENTRRTIEAQENP
jgi:outer membrane biogenesis lipoprotein LolB